MQFDDTQNFLLDIFSTHKRCCIMVDTSLERQYLEPPKTGIAFIFKTFCYEKNALFSIFQLWAHMHMFHHKIFNNNLCSLHEWKLDSLSFPCMYDIPQELFPLDNKKVKWWETLNIRHFYNWGNLFSHSKSQYFSPKIEKVVLIKVLTNCPEKLFFL